MSTYLYRRGGGVTSHNVAVIGTSINCCLFWCVHSPSVLSLTPITALQLNCQLWLNQIFGQIIQTNHGQSLSRQHSGSDRGLPALVWTSGPHLTAAVCLLSIIISWHRLYLLYLVSSQYLGPHSIYITRLWDTTTCRRDMAVAPPSPGCKEGKYAERIYLNLHDFLCLVANLSE